MAKLVQVAENHAEEEENVKTWKRIFVWMICVLFATGLCQSAGIVRAEEEGTGSGAVSGNEAGSYGAEGNSTNAEMLEGNGSDITISGVSISGSKAGGKVTISFTATGNKNSKKHYEVEKIERIYPVLNESFPFTMDDEAYRVTGGTGNSVQCSYRFVAKDNLETAYYLTGFTVVYSRKNMDGKTASYDSEYYVNKNISVKLTAKKKSNPESTAEVAAQDEDVSLKMNNTPSGSYGGSCAVAFTAYSSQYKITSVVPVIGENFPFESTSDAYKVIRSKGSSRLACRYQFRVKEDVATGYQGVVFKITYIKGKTSATMNKTVNVQLTGKKKTGKNGNGKKSTPRVMVTGYTTDVKKITPNSKFNLSLQVKNNSNKTVKNVKFTLSTANGEFLPVSGASTAYADYIGAKGTVNISFLMKASAGLGARSYPITVKTEYEDEQAGAYDSQDNVSIPVTLKDRISLTEVTPPDMLSVGGEADLAFSINNMGAGQLNNVTVSCKGNGIKCEESFVGNIASGATGYANVTLTGTEVTPEDSDGEECTIIIKYENASGESKTYTEKTKIFVGEDMGDVEDWEEGGMMDDEMAQKKGMPKAVIVILIMVVLAAIVLIVRRIQKKKRLLMEEELMDDELL